MLRLSTPRPEVQIMLTEESLSAHLPESLAFTGSPLEEGSEDADSSSCPSARDSARDESVPTASACIHTGSALARAGTPVHNLMAAFENPPKPSEECARNESISTASACLHTGPASARAGTPVRNLMAAFENPSKTGIRSFSEQNICPRSECIDDAEKALVYLDDLD
jgi:hypothetical protein